MTAIDTKGAATTLIKEQLPYVDPVKPRGISLIKLVKTHSMAGGRAEPSHESALSPTSGRAARSAVTT